METTRLLNDDGTPKKVPYLDLYGLREDDRITMIAQKAQETPGALVGCIVEYLEDGPKAMPGEKGDRYIRKMKLRFPNIEVEFRGHLTGNKTTGTELIRFRIRSILPSVLPSDLAGTPSPGAN